MFDAETINRINKIMRGSINRNEIPGGSVLVLKEGREVFYHADGFADREAGVRIGRHSIFRLYSMSKPVTACAVAILLERGEIDLYDPVSAYLPGFRNQMVEEGGRLVPVKRDVTIMDLLSMTSGLVYEGENRAGNETEALFREIEKGLSGGSSLSTVEAMNLLGECPLAFQPGSSWQYGSSADVLGALVEIASGMSFGDFMRKEIFEPLDMPDTDFFVSPEKRDRFVKAYTSSETRDLLVYTDNFLGINNQMNRKPAFESGGAGLVSTIDDYARFANMLMGEGILDGVRVLRSRTVKFLTSRTLTAEQQKGFDLDFHLCGYSYGNLMRLNTNCGKTGMIASPGEYGWDGWLGGYFCNCPKDALTILFMTQKTDSGTLPITRRLRNIILSLC